MKFFRGIKAQRNDEGEHHQPLAAEKDNRAMRASALLIAIKKGGEVNCPKISAINITSTLALPSFLNLIPQFHHAGFIGSYLFKVQGNLLL
jgi:hypothetical protein